MLLQVTEIEFDFDTDDGEPSIDYQSELTSEVVGNIYDIDMSGYDNPDDVEIECVLMEEIECETGWYVKRIDYRHVLS